MRYLKYKKGVSGVIVTVLLVVLALVLIGIVWAVVAGLVEEGASGIVSSNDCLKLGLEVTSLVNTSLTNYSLTVQRAPGSASMGGYKVVLFNATKDSSSVLDVPGSIEELASVTSSSLSAGIVNANIVQLTPYLEGDALCPTKSFDFS